MSRRIGRSAYVALSLATLIVARPACAAEGDPAASTDASPVTQGAVAPAVSPPASEPAVTAQPTPTPQPATTAADTPAAAPTPAAPPVAEQPTPTPPAPTTAEQAPAPAPPPAPAQSVAERMAPQIHAALDALQKSELPKGLATLTRKQREAVAAFYAERADAPLWIGADGQWTAAARAALTRLAHADEDALDLRLGSLPVLAEGDDAARATTDVALSMAVVVYAREASEGRVDPRTVSNQIDDMRKTIPPAQVLADVAAAADADATLRAYNPPQPGYAALREKLAELRREKPRTAEKTIPNGPVLMVGMRDARVPLVRARFGLDLVAGPARPDDLLYDTRVAAAVADFQKEKGIPASGHLTRRTIEALSNHDSGRLEGEIVANMERWRWMPREMGDDRIEVNIPDYALKVVQRDAVVHRARVVVGKADTPTPVFSNAMQFIIVNPYWNVPQSIIQKEMLPHLAEDPNYLTKMGYEVLHKKGKLIVRQPPGERNALGRIKFMFPNDHAVYLHDTPSRGLFASTKRAFSHGCVRVDQPLALAETVLGKKNGWSQERFKKLIGGDEKTVKLPTALPIHIEYFTAYVDENGKLQTRDDVYGYSKKVRQALGYQS